MAASDEMVGYGPLACRLAEAVGLEPNRTLGFTITVFPNSIITINSQQNANEGIIEDVCRVFSEEMPNHPVSSVHAIPHTRQEDLRQRASGSALTHAESLALAVLRGGSNGEDAVGMLIDACLEEFGHGSYRVPVRVIGDRNRMKLIIKQPPGVIADQAMRRHVISAAKEWMDSDRTAMVLPSGWSLEVFECATSSVEIVG